MISIRPLEDADLLPVLQFFNEIVANLDALRAVPSSAEEGAVME